MVWCIYLFIREFGRGRGVWSGGGFYLYTTKEQDVKSGIGCGCGCVFKGCQN